MIVAKRRMPRPRQARTFDLDAVSGQAQRAWSSGCAGKARYTSEAAARAGIGLQLGQSALDAYRCTHCSGWHLTEVRAPGAGKRTLRKVHHLWLSCGRCQVAHEKIAASSCPWTPATRRVALTQLEDAAIADGWSIGLDEHDHCPACAAALGLETMLTAAALHASTEAAPAAAPPPSQRQGEGKAQMQGHDPGPPGHGRKAHR